jgi:IS30 family transposase
MTHLSLDERYVISQRRLQGVSQKEIARELGRAPSTICRELRRNPASDNLYHALRAEKRAKELQRRPRTPRRMDQPEIRALVCQKLALNWAPAQISGWLAVKAHGKVISHQTIYSYLWRLPKDDAFRRAMRRRGRRYRKAKPGFVTAALRNRVSIHDRPQAVNERRRVGDWELDLVTCRGASGYLITAVERKSGYLLVRKVARKQSGMVINGIIKMFSGFERSILKTFTFDNGSEFYYHRLLREKLGVDVYFADPYCSGQRGTNENTNGLLRQYFPRTLGYGQISHWAVKRAQKKINERPRLRLNFQTPTAVLGKHSKIAFRN